MIWVPLALLVPTERTDPPALKVPVDVTALMVPPVALESVDVRELVELTDLLVLMVSLVMMVLWDPVVLMDPWVPLVSVDPSVLMELQEKKVLRGLLALLAQLVSVDLLVTPVRMVLRALLVMLALMASRDHLAPLALSVLMDPLDLR